MMKPVYVLIAIIAAAMSGIVLFDLLELPVLDLLEGKRPPNAQKAHRCHERKGMACMVKWFHSSPPTAEMLAHLPEGAADAFVAKVKIAEVTYSRPGRIIPFVLRLDVLESSGRIQSGPIKVGITGSNHFSELNLADEKNYRAQPFPESNNKEYYVVIYLDKNINNKPTISHTYWTPSGRTLIKY